MSVHPEAQPNSCGRRPQKFETQWVTETFSTKACNSMMDVSGPRARVQQTSKTLLQSRPPCPPLGNNNRSYHASSRRDGALQPRSNRGLEKRELRSNDVMSKSQVLRHKRQHSNKENQMQNFNVHTTANPMKAYDTYGE